MTVTKIKMKPGCANSNDLLEIDSLYIGDCGNPGFFTKSIIHNFLKDNPGSIQVGIYPYPNVIPATSSRGEKYVRSSANAYLRDNLLNLPRE